MQLCAPVGFIEAFILLLVDACECGQNIRFLGKAPNQHTASGIERSVWQDTEAARHLPLDHLFAEDALVRHIGSCDAAAQDVSSRAGTTRVQRGAGASGRLRNAYRYQVFSVADDV